jgi:hypothetical protein
MLTKGYTEYYYGAWVKHRSIMTISALKEWAIVCKGFEEGKQVILLRKGGIMERRHGFELKHNDFYMFPTYEHQSRDLLQHDYADKFESVLQSKPTDDQNTIHLYAKVIYITETFNREMLYDLRGFHIWNEKYVNQRMDYNPEKPLSIVLLRVYRLNKSLNVTLSPQQAGCRSWIDFHSSGMEDLGDNVGKPVLSNDKFQERQSQLMEVLNI